MSGFFLGSDGEDIIRHILSILALLKVKLLWKQIFFDEPENLVLSFEKIK
jgi:hypothetical protein